MQGNEYQAQVFITATDTTQMPEISIGNFTTSTNADGTPKYEMSGEFTKLIPDETGKGIYKVRAGTVGQKTWGGLITMKAPDGTLMSYPFKSDYSVGAPNVVVSPTAMNVLYAGIDNPLSISVPGVGNDKIRATMKNGDIGRGQVKNSKGEFFPGEWKALPTVVGQIAQVIVSAEINGKQQTFAPYDFRVKAIPKPNAAFATKTGEAEISKAEIILQQAVFANLEGFDFDLRYTVTEFRISTVDKGFDISQDSKSNRLTDAQKALLNGLTRGKKLYIERIKAVGPDKKPQDLSPIIITVN
jgi:gliding motility-associated protein GldM